VRPDPNDTQKLLYTPTAGFSGIDTFAYGMVNDFNRESSATFSVFVNAAGNQPPVAANQTITLQPVSPQPP